jgi:hypothetical protein
VLARDLYSVIGAEVDRRIILSDPGIDDFRNEMLWSPEHPTLLDARIRLLSGGTVIDEVCSYTALRAATISRDRFALNGRPYLLRLVLDQGYWPDTLLAAPSDDALRRDVELAKAMGFNGVRKHQKIENPRYLYWADRLGLLVWEEMPSAYRFTDVAIRRTVREWTEAIDRDASHPCIVVWVPYNESWGVPELPTLHQHRHAVEGLYHLTKTLDTTRPVVGNDGWENLVSDMIGVHDYNPSGEVLAERYGSYEAFERTLAQVRPYYRRITLPGLVDGGQPLIVSEFGGTTYDAGREDFWNGYGAVGSAEELLERYRELVTALLSSPAVAGFCYTQLTDTAQERNGLLTEDRVPKVDPKLVAEVNRQPSAAVPGQALEEIQIVHAARRQQP